MLKLIKMNLYRMLNTNSLIIILVLTMLFGWASAYVFYGDSTYSASDYENESGTDEEEGIPTKEDEDVTIIIGFSSTTDYEASPSLYNAFVLATSDIGSCLPLLLIGIGAVLFIGAESKFGFTKNLVSHNISKSKVYMAKCISYWVYALVVMLGYLISMLLTLMILYGKEMDYSMELFPEFMKCFGLHFILTLAYCSGLILINSVTKSTAISVTACCLTTTSFISTSILVPLEMRFNIELVKYTVCKNMMDVNINATDKSLCLALGVGLGALLVYNVLGNIWVTKRDVV